MSNVWEILVPVTYPSGRKIKKRYHRQWDAQVRAITTGLTIMRPGKGHWISPAGVLFTERMIPVRIVCDELAMQHIAAITLEHYRQEAVMVTRLGTGRIIFAEKK